MEIIIIILINTLDVNLSQDTNTINDFSNNIGEVSSNPYRGNDIFPETDGYPGNNSGSSAQEYHDNNDGLSEY